MHDAPGPHAPQGSAQPTPIAALLGPGEPLRGWVSLVGAGPGQADLLTLAGRDRLARADVVIVDYLVNPSILAHCRADAEVVQRAAGPHAGERLEQARVNDELVALSRAGKHVVRLKGGDPMIFGRGAEELAILRAHGIPYEVIPGVSASIAAPECAGIAVTHRQHTPAVCIVSGWEAYDKAGMAVAWQHLANSAGTLVLMMSVRNADENAQRLIDAGRSPDTPAAMIRWGTRGIQRTVIGTLATIAEIAAREGMRAPAVLVVGEVVSLRAQLEWFESRPLSGVRVAIGRTAGSDSDLLATLQRLGADAFELVSESFEQSGDLAQIGRAIVDARDSTGLIVTSGHGADALADALTAADADARCLSGRTLLAIGAGTARRLRRRCLRPDVICDSASSEAIVGAIERLGKSRAPWQIIRGDRGRDVIEQHLMAHGGTLQVLTAYRMVSRALSRPLLESMRPAERGGEGLDVLLVGSAATAIEIDDQLRRTLGDEETARILSGAKIIALGPVMVRACQELGWNVAVTAADTSPSARLQAILRAAGRG